jgi:hypothetical protein
LDANRAPAERSGAPVTARLDAAQTLATGTGVDQTPTFRRREIREFLMSRRARVTPEQAGLYVLDGDVRRVPGLRREEVADLAGVSAD